MTPEQRADELWRMCFADDDVPDRIFAAPGYFRQVVAASIRAAERDVWEEAAAILRALSKERNIAMSNHMALTKTEAGDRLINGHRGASICCDNVASIFEQKAKGATNAAPSKSQAVPEASTHPTILK